MKKCKVNKYNIIDINDNKAVIFDGEKSMLYSFNETATFIFNKLKKGLSDKEITAELIKKYGIAESKAIKDVKETISDLLKKKIFVKIK